MCQQYASLDGFNVFTGNNEFTQPLIINNLSFSNSFKVKEIKSSGSSLPIETIAGNFFIQLFNASNVGNPLFQPMYQEISLGTTKARLGNLNFFKHLNVFTKKLKVKALIFNNKTRFVTSPEIVYSNQCIRFIVDNTPYFVPLFKINKLKPLELRLLQPPLIRGTNPNFATLCGDNIFDGTNNMLDVNVPELIFTSPSVKTPFLNLGNSKLMAVYVLGEIFYVELAPAFLI